MLKNAGPYPTMPDIGSRGKLTTILLAIFIPGSFYRAVIIITLYSEVL
jgi:hypothetical protein